MKRSTLIVVAVTFLFGIVLLFLVVVYDRQLKEIDKKIEEKNARTTK